ncbi:hypothetical protein H0B56_10420 [Haloechinothrix sp. YIM 98757]|uniref:Chromosome segregation ATPase n=1 Tax=Haloechinothrix aidingensis TaxID=2752311 RepID=A0A837ZZB7_9PSEU|nr:hypothetical protein [Haloechinothrix aidingensis]MBA0125956.1 hypothetical protein [Haloechinothrix aidingensis]
MYELSRVRLHSVGPAGARYQDVVLDLSGVGEVVSAPAQDALFSAGVQLSSGADAEAAAPVRRPSPASVLFLENGGGKSVLIKLIFSVMLPGRRQVVGTTNTRVLEKFVESKDVAHVVLEWQHTRTGQRLITGKVSEWRGHVVSSDPANLVDSWYCFRPSVTLNLDSLPLTSNGQLLTVSAFKESLDAQHKAEPEVDLFWTRKHRDWTDRLAQLGLDTELFRYQRAMNAGEGEAVDAFAFQTDDAFVEFLLRAVIDEQGPADLADVLSSYADNLAQRGELLVERDFVAGALELLEPLVESSDAAAGARQESERAREQAREFAAAVAARRHAESERLQGLRDHVEELRTAERLAEGDHRRKGAVVTELRRVVALLRLDAGQADADRLAEQVAEADTTARAWRATSTVLAHLNAAHKAKATRELVGNREERAQPALAAKNAAATALARGLLALAEDARADAEHAERAAESARRSAADAQHQRDEAMAKAAEHSARAESLDSRIAEVEQRVREAVEAGTLPEGTDTDGVAAAERSAREAAERAERDLAQHERELAEIETEHAEATGALHTEQQRRSSARARAESAQAELDRANERTEALAADPRLAELLGGESVHLDVDLPVLLNRLSEARNRADREATELRMAESADERALQALGSAGLLPPPEDVQQVLDVLEDAGITAWSGLRYLSTLSSARAGDVLNRFPQLVGGVLINDPSRVERAREVLSETTLLPRAALAVGCTQAVSGPGDSGGSGDTAAPDGAGSAVAPGVEFVIPPNPALYDEDAADRERTAITRRQAERKQELARLAEQSSSDAALEWKLRAWREEYPAGSVATLAERAEEAWSEYEQAGVAEARASETVEYVARRRAELRELIPELRASVRSATERVRELGELSGSVARVGQWRDEARAAREQAERLQSEASDAEAVAGRWREQAAEEQRTADGHHRTVASARAELAEVPGGGSVSTDEPVPEEPIDVLRRSLAAADDAYAKVEVGNDLRAELDHSEQAEAAARAELEALDPDVRALAEHLLETPDGADAASRAAAQQRAERELDSAQAQRSDAVAAVATQRAELEALPAAPSVLDDFQRPGSVAYGLELISNARDEVAAAARELEDLQQKLTEAEDVLDDAESAAAGFAMLGDSMAPIVGAGAGERTDEVEAYDGDIESARSRWSVLNSALAAADEAVAEADRRVRGQADALVEYAAEERFEKLSSPVRRQIVSVRRDKLGEHAREWISALRPRLRSLTGDLEQIDRHRSGIVTRLQGMVEGALRVLRSAQRLSRLPDGLGDWSGSEFLRIRFTDPDESMLVEQLGQVVDEVAAGKSPDGKDVRRDGMSLLLRGVRAAVPKGFRIDVLKPDSVLRTERQRVSEIKDVFSGGQQLTAAIVLYCTMAALRANDKGRTQESHSGVLFLDNPIGRASAGYLLELQRAVARALGVQLIYTTGLFDAGALSEFPLIIRMRNDADLRAGRKYLAVDATMREAVESLGEPDGVGRVSATRVYDRGEA